MFSICFQQSTWNHCEIARAILRTSRSQLESKQHFSSERSLHWQAMHFRFQPCLAECLESTEVIHVLSCLIAMSLVRRYFWYAIYPYETHWNTVPKTHATHSHQRSTQSCSWNPRSHCGLPKFVRSSRKMMDLGTKKYLICSHYSICVLKASGSVKHNYIIQAAKAFPKKTPDLLS